MQNDKARHAMYAKVEIARKQLPGMDNDDVFRDWLASKFYGKRSRKDLTFPELKRLVDLLARMGAVYLSPARASCAGRAVASPEVNSCSLPCGAAAVPGGKDSAKRSGKRRARPYVRSDFIEIPPDDPHAATKRMICAIWRKLGYAMTGLETRLERQTGIVTILGLHDGKQLSAILTDLRKREKSHDHKLAATGEVRA